MNIFFINDSSSNSNWGDRAAAIALREMIKTLGGTLSHILTEDDLRDSIFFSQPSSPSSNRDEGRSLEDWARLLLPPVTLKLRKKLLQHLKHKDEVGPIPHTVDEYEYCADLLMRDTITFGHLLDAISMADVIVIHGDGCMVGNGVLPRSELFLSYVAKTRFHKPVALINHTTDFHHPELNRMAEAVYPLLDDVTYRDQTSAELCLDRWPGRYAADTAFQFKPAERDTWAKLAARPTYFDVWPDKATFDPRQPYVCVGGSSIYSFDRGPDDVIEDFIILLSHLQKVYSGQIVLTASDIKDQIIFRPVSARLNLPLVGLTVPVQQAVDIIGNAQAYIGGRWHPSIFALRGGTPVIPLTSKTFKMQALIAMAGLPITTFNALSLSGEKEHIGQTLLSLVRRDKELRPSLRQWGEQQAESSWDNLAILKRWAKSAKRNS
jgi:polysaccharide pyruvyl transferase WcaK-like protein